MGVCSAHAAIILTSAAIYNNQGFVTGAGGTGAGTGDKTPGLGEGCG
jgi:rhodanese-related sulfurtransferase